MNCEIPRAFITFDTSILNEDLFTRWSWQMIEITLVEGGLIIDTVPNWDWIIGASLIGLFVAIVVYKIVKKHLL